MSVSVMSEVDSAGVAAERGLEICAQRARLAFRQAPVGLDFKMDVRGAARELVLAS